MKHFAKDAEERKKSKCGGTDMKKQNIPEEKGPKTGQLQETVPTR